MTPTPPRRRWFQFGLSSLLLLMFVVALAVYGFTEHRERRRLDERNALLEERNTSLEVQNESLLKALGDADTNMRKQLDSFEVIKKEAEASYKDAMQEFKQKVDDLRRQQEADAKPSPD